MSKSNFLDDLTTGLKGIRGAGDALRGELMEAVDHAFDSNSSHPTTADDINRNHTISEKGKADMAAADNMIARHEQQHREKKAAKTGIASTGAAETGAASAAFSNQGAQTGAAPVATHESTADAYAGGAAAPATTANTAAAAGGPVPVGQPQTGVPVTGTEGTASHPVV